MNVLPASERRELPPRPSPRVELPVAPDPSSVHSLEEALGLPRVMCAILATRGLGDPERAKGFLRPLLSTLHPPGGLNGLPEAVARIREAIEGGETIFVHGDYDVDGMAGTALLTQWLRRLGARVEPFIPNRLADGYDLGPVGLQEARKAGASVLITVDCGILAHEAVSEAVASGIQVIVTDHHSPGPELPDALAVLNPNRFDSAYPEKGLCGAGVAFKLCQGLGEAFGTEGEALHPLLDLVALATIADLVPLTGENRTLVRFGLKALARTRNPGLTALMELAGIDGEAVTAGTVAFGLAPRLNAVGRLGDPNLALRLLLTEDPDEAREMAREAEAMNRARRATDKKTLEEALAQLSATFEPGEDYGVVLSSESWHPGVVGIVASRVVERIHRPAVLVAFNGNLGKGSARSIPGFHLLDAIRGAGEHLDRFGGHRQAAGMELRRENLSAFREAFNREARAALEGRDLRPSLRVDLEVELGEMTREMFGFLQYIGPHGIGNPRPVFLAREVEVAGSPRVVGTNHLKLRLRQGEAEMDAIGFGLAGRIDPRRWRAGTMDVVFQLRENEFRGVKSLQADVKDLRPTGAAAP